MNRFSHRWHRSLQRCGVLVAVGCALATVARAEEQQPATRPATAAKPTTAPSAEAASATDESLSLLRLVTFAQTAVKQKAYGGSPIIGGAFAKAQFVDVPPAGAVLTGFRIGLGTFINYPIIYYLQPIYMTADGEVLGQGQGKPVDTVYVAKAPPGYAVGGITAYGGGGLDSIILTYMKIKGSRLDPNDECISQRVGGPGGSKRVITGDGDIAVGVYGRSEEGSYCVGVGLVFSSLPRR